MKITAYSDQAFTSVSHNSPYGVITPNHIPLTIVTYTQKSYRSRISNHWATIPACSVVPPIYKQSKKTNCVIYHFSDLQEVYSGNHQIHTKCQFHCLHQPQISTSKYLSLCNNSSHTKSY